MTARFGDILGVALPNIGVAGHDDRRWLYIGRDPLDRHRHLTLFVSHGILGGVSRLVPWDSLEGFEVVDVALPRKYIK